MNTYRVQIRASFGGWTYAYITAQTMYDARDLAAAMYGDAVMGYPDLVRQ